MSEIKKVDEQEVGFAAALVAMIKRQGGSATISRTEMEFSGALNVKWADDGASVTLDVVESKKHS